MAIKELKGRISKLKIDKWLSVEAAGRKLTLVVDEETLVEISRLGVKTGARKETFYGLSGLGDLATTCMSSHSRNRWCGEEIGKGKKLKDILEETDMVIEGVATSKSCYELSKKYDVEMPIITKIYEVLYQDKDPKEAVRELMTRTPKVSKRASGRGAVWLSALAWGARGPRFESARPDSTRCGLGRKSVVRLFLP